MGHLICTMGPGDQLAWDYGKNRNMPPALEQLQCVHAHPWSQGRGTQPGKLEGGHGTVKYSRKCT